MKTILSKTAVSIACFLLVLSGIIFFSNTQTVYGADLLKFNPQIPIPGMSGETPVGHETNGIIKSDLLARYIKSIYDYSFIIVGILAAVVLMGGGILWLTSGGSETSVKRAKDLIAGSITGLAILFSSWIILNTVNPELLKLGSISLLGVDEAALNNSENFNCCECHVIAVGGTHGTQYDNTCISNTGYTEKSCEEYCEEREDNFDPTGFLNAVNSSFVYNIDHKCGATEETKNKCVPYDNDQTIMFSTTFDSTGWAFDPGIKAQIGDIGPELAQLLNCMRSKLNPGIGRISSISDSNYIGNLSTCNQILCYNADPKCVHACTSCHYGGGSLSATKSYAVDLGDEENSSYIKAAARACDYNAFSLTEGNHVHISSSSCQKN